MNNVFNLLIDLFENIRRQHILVTYLQEKSFLSIGFKAKRVYAMITVQKNEFNIKSRCDVPNLRTLDRIKQRVLLKENFLVVGPNHDYQIWKKIPPLQSV